MAYGSREDVRVEATFALLSALRARARSKLHFEIILYTDAPQLYAAMPIGIRHKSTEEFRAWQGSHGYIHRIKTCVLLDALRSIDGEVLAVDADTWFIKSPDNLWEPISNDEVVMHLREGYAHESADADTRSMASNYSGREYIDERVHFPEVFDIWNAGVIGLSSRNTYLIDSGLRILDHILDANERATTIEQLVMNGVLGGLQRVPASPVIYHYWHPSVRSRAHAELPPALERVANLDFLEQAEALHHSRPRASLPDQLRQRARRIARQAGFHPSTVASSAT